VILKGQQEQWLRNILLVDAQGFDNSFLARKFCHLTTVYRLKKYEYPQLAPTVSASHFDLVTLCGVDIHVANVLMSVAGCER
jgi:hypothetical protein